jgi:hypothetical protein
MGKEWHMRAAIFILILILSPQGLRADTANTVKKTHHHKVAKVAHHVQRSKKMDTTGRYKLVAYYKDGKLKHKYLDTQPTPAQPNQEIATRAPANQNNQNIPEELKLEHELDSRVNSLNTD